MGKRSDPLEGTRKGKAGRVTEGDHSRGSRRVEVDYLDLFWRISSYWPHIPQLSQPQLFGHQSLNFVSQALDYGRKLELEKLHALEKPIARLNCEFINTKIDRKKHPPIELSEYYLYKPEPEDEEITPEIANTIHRVMADGHVPEWLYYPLPRRDVFQFCKGYRTLRPRLWIDAEGECVALFCPWIKGDKVEAGAAIILDGFTGDRLLRDVDSNELHLVQIPEQIGENVAVYNEQYKLL